jgi:hypothetical protein
MLESKTHSSLIILHFLPVIYLKLPFLKLKCDMGQEKYQKSVTYYLNDF